ncbi:hypothetical protein Pmani_015569 [Petrolisthes manimaculis]|uniref:DNA endonuclease activator Ctp1 C-terminal domain-containing protein n=1 Tax=Petrolisthes manimaculis TaxID=1843537 RepID=A0AAE1PRC2_9EUCA|nr:hypothetical protein Pmani_015569 [Petrolisthes manimaculis]
MGNPAITKFWSSIINDDDYQEQLQSVLTIADKEERALQMMARTLFLFIMEIKAERDEVLKKMKEFSNVCVLCQKVLPKTTHDKPGPEKMNMDIVSCSNNKNNPQALPNSPDVIDVSPITSCRGPCVVSEGNDSIPGSKTKANRHYNCLSRSPMKRFSSYIKSPRKGVSRSPLKGLSRSPLKSNYNCLSRSPLRRCSSYTKNGMSDDETETTATTSKPLMPVILVPETQLVTENRLRINLPERKALAKQSVYHIPETLDIESSRSIDDDEATGNRDFWDDSEKCGEVGGLCGVVDGLRTPTKSNTRCKSAGSPVLGKQSHSSQRNVPLLTLDILTEPQENVEENVKESKATLTPETPPTLKPKHTTPTTTLKHKHTTPTTPPTRPEHTITTLRPEQTSSATTTTLRPDHTTPTTKTAFRPEHTETATTNTAIRPEHITSPTPRYSPLVFAHGLSTSLNDSTETSPSLLQTVNKMGTRSCIEVPVNRKAEQLAEGISEARKKCIEPVVVKSFHRSGDSTNSHEFVARKKTRLQKSMSSLNTSSKGRILRKHQTSDNHRQEGGGSGGGVYKLTVTSPVAQGKRTYKQTKISEVLFQKTRQTGDGDGQAQGRIEEDEEAAFLAAVKESMKTKELDDLHRQKQQQEKRKMEEYKEESPIKIPRLSLHKPSPHKYSLRSTPDSPVKSSPSKGKIQETLLFTSKTVQSMRQKVEQNKDSVTEKDITKQQEPKTKQGDGVLQMDELIKQVPRNPNVKPCEASNLKSPQRKLSSKLSSARNTRKLMHDSFDLLPEKNAGPGFAHQGDVVRGKTARQQLEGWECRECEQWYTDANLDPQEKKMLMNKCSRHRSKHNPVTNTPKGFWNPDWVDD